MTDSWSVVDVSLDDGESSDLNLDAILVSVHLDLARPRNVER